MSSREFPLCDARITTAAGNHRAALVVAAAAARYNSDRLTLAFYECFVRVEVTISLFVTELHSTPSPPPALADGRGA